MSLSFDIQHARSLDEQDPLSRFRTEFCIPQHAGSDCIYFTGNSLGLQPRKAADALNLELNDWAEHGVEGHFRARHPWVNYHERFTEGLCHLTGGLPHEVVAMNALTVNLHLLLVSFYRPAGKRRKILCESKAFPSDQYALASQIRFHGFDPESNLIEVAPRPGEHVLRIEDIEEAIREAGDTLATVMMGGVNYYSGARLDMERITAAAHSVGAHCGFDLAHAMGNVPLSLHEWGVDFACWCSYKYLNSGPGAVSGVFVHENHVGDPDIPRFNGWWGHNAERRFLMEEQFDAMPSAEAWQMSNAPILNMAVHKVALDLFLAAGISALRERGDRLTHYLEQAIADAANQTQTQLEVITPSNPAERGCQLSVVAHGFGRPLFDALTQAGVVADWREPNVIRMAPVPLYNSFEDISRFHAILLDALAEHYK
ncbi:MAG: kynureninase [Flavobacteriales bacterium]